MPLKCEIHSFQDTDLRDASAVLICTICKVIMHKLAIFSSDFHVQGVNESVAIKIKDNVKNQHTVFTYYYTLLLHPVF